jgi:hypothetical protein
MVAKFGLPATGIQLSPPSALVMTPVDVAAYIVPELCGFTITAKTWFEADESKFCQVAPASALFHKAPLVPSESAVAA